MAGEDTIGFSDTNIRKLERENQLARMELATLERDLLGHIEDTESYENTVTLLTNQRTLMNKELQNVKSITQKLSKELNDWDGSVQKPLQHYKDMKKAVESYSAVRGNMQKFLSQIESSSAEVDSSLQVLKSSVTSAITMSKDELQKVAEENKGAISGLQTQLKIIETRKKSLQSQLDQKTDENKELTKICEELISQR